MGEFLENLGLWKIVITGIVAAALIVFRTFLSEMAKSAWKASLRALGWESKSPPAQTSGNVNVTGGTVKGQVVAGGVSAERDVRIGTHDTIIESAQIVQSAPAAITLHQLPSDITDFTGREKEITRLEGLVVEAAVKRKGAVLTSLQGLGGVGKTALAVHVAHKIKDRFPDAQLFINLRGAGTDQRGREILGDPMTPEEALAGLIRPFHPDAKLPDDLDSLSAIFRSDLEGKRVLILLDNAKDAEQVTAICPGTELPDCAVLITSRQTITLSGLDSVNLDVLPENEAVDLLQRICGRIDDGQAKKIAKLCGYLPLALRLVASTLKASINIPVEKYIAQLEDEGKRLGVLKHAHESVAAALNLSVDQLDDETKPRWAMLSVFPATFEINGVAAVWQMPAEDALPILTDLFQRNLVLYDQEARRYRLHDLLRLLARGHIGDDAAYSAAHRHAEHYMMVLRASKELYKAGGDNVVAGLGIFDVERENIEAGQVWAALHADTDKEAAALCNFYPDAGVHILSLRLHPRERINWLESALRAARTLKHRAAEGVHLGNLGLAWADLDEFQRAIEFYEQVLIITREIGDRLGEGNSLGNLGNAYYFLGEPRRAIKFHDQQLTITREIGDRRGEGNALGSLGNAWAKLGAPRRAIEFYEKSLVIKREIGDRHGEANSCWNMGDQLAKLGELERAIGLMQSCVDYEREIGHPDAEKDAAHVDDLRRKLKDQSK